VKPSFIVGGGSTGALIASMDWSGSPLGPLDGWPQSLRTALSICLGSRFPIAIYWGPQFLMLYNDDLLPMVGANKHPASMGQPGLVVLAEIRDLIEPLLRRVTETGEAIWSEDMMLPLLRGEAQQESYFTFTYSPIRDEATKVGGVFCAVVETTEQVIEERRLRLLNALAAATQADTPELACEQVAAQLATATNDVPFALLYMLDESARVAKLVGSANMMPGGARSPAHIPFGDRSAWPFDDVEPHATPRFVVLDDLPGARGAAILPIERSGGGRPFGFVVAGLAPMLRPGESYDRFHKLLAASVAQVVSGAAAYDEERKRAEALAELDRAKTKFFGNVSHEFRTPLTLLLGPAADALAETNLTPRERERWRLVHANAQRLQKLVNTLLDFSRIEAGRAQARYAPTDLAALTTDLASAFRSATERAGVAFEVDCPPLPEAVFVDRDMWEKIVLNLLSNAFKFTHQGTIAIRLSWSDDGATLVVRDTGVGIAEADLPHVFDRFYRVEGVRARTHEGSGIGLALVRELVRLHGGSAHASSVLGAGTVFTVVVPAGRAHLPADRVDETGASMALGAQASDYVDEALRWLPGSSRPSQLPPAAVDTGSFSMLPAKVDGRVLVADDNTDMREYLTRILAPHWAVEAVANGEAARERLVAGRYDLVLADVMMPELDGFGLLRAIRSDPATAAVPVVLLSARAGEEARIEGLRAGADDYVVKPFSSRDLLARVAAHVALGRARASERAAQDRLRSFLMQAPIAVSIVRGSEFVYELANTAYERMIGRHGIVGKPFREVFPEMTDDAPVLQVLRGVVATGEPFRAPEFRVPLAGPSGAIEDAYFLFTSQPVADGTGKIDTVLTAAVDVTEQVRLREGVESARRALERALDRAETSEAEYRELIDNLPELAWNARPDGQIDFYNRRWYEYTGTTFEETQGQGWERVHHPDYLPKVVQRWKRCLATGEPFEMEFPLLGADGTFRWFLTRVRPFRDASGTIVRWFGTNANVHDLREATRKAEAASLAKDEFLATASHELRTPLNAILGWTLLLRGGTLEASGTQRAVEVIERNARAQVQLIEDILDGSRIITGKLVLEIRPLDMTLLVAAAMDAVRPAAQAKGIEVSVITDPEAARILGDPERLQQVVWNLANNAIKFTPKGGRVEVRLERVGTSIRLVVEDSGQGIAAEFLPHVFERFRQAEGGTTRRYGGLGLGLALVRHLIDAHGGTVRAESDGEGRGARFTVTLPVQAVYASTAADRVRPLVREAARPPARLDGVRALVVDDEVDARDLVATVLTGHGARVTTASSVAEALALWAESAPTVLVSDIGMPGTDGYELVRRLRAMSDPAIAGVPAIALTAYAREEDRRRALDAGFQSHVAKPVEPAELVRVVAELLQR
jgi:PAS domain S-box-containing protein